MPRVPQPGSLVLDTAHMKGIVHAKMGTIKTQKQYGPRRGREIKQRWQGYTELYRKGLNDPDNHQGVISHLEADWGMKSSGPHYEQRQWE